MAGQLSRRSSASRARRGVRAETAAGSPALVFRLQPLAVCWISVAFAVIAAIWITNATTRADWVVLAALAGSYVAGRAGRLLGGAAPPASIAWGIAACALLTEFITCAALAAAGSLHPAAAGLSGPAAGALHGTFLADFGGAGPTGLWRLAVTAVMIAVLLPMTDLCLRDTIDPGPRRLFIGVSGDARLLLAGLVLLLAGERAALAALLALGLAALGATIIDGIRVGARRELVRSYRGDGRISVWIGGFVGGRIPPLPPLFVGLLVTGVLAALGLRNLSGLLILTPVEAMLIAAFGSWHPHDGRGDWAVPPLIQAAEYVFMAELGFASRLWPGVTFALIAAVGLRHLDLAYRARGGLASGMDRRGLGWDGRMLVVGVAGAIGIQLAVYPLLALGLWWLTIRDWAVGWTGQGTVFRAAPARRSAADG
jgi:Family of unknown function (DUF5941)